MITDEYLIRSLIKLHHHWPEKGKIYIDLSPIYGSPQAMHMVADTLTQQFLNQQHTHIVSIETSGLPVASLIAYSLAIPLVIIRKNNFSPGLAFDKPGRWFHEQVREQRTLSLPEGAIPEESRVLLFDDLVYSGETLRVASALITRNKAEVTDFASIVNYGEDGAKRIQQLEIPYYSLITLE
ncbi:adenine phosphoribosyltransferase [Oleiphilus messinensis]|uniref:Adenine phosphoribosyltransferase n=1 Tax=Oleiphilus messinensis TaxID=141451 RepID=A0A1Y0I740_9GAMM|nr:phosphoribosyltransferase family protein [Oleiphilus messinensis]ARU56317.1 adenine phosphoribosyltransferase [Oleiphilus messinensis]